MKCLPFEETKKKNRCKPEINTGIRFQKCKILLNKCDCMCIVSETCSF